MKTFKLVVALAVLSLPALADSSGSVTIRSSDGKNQASVKAASTAAAAADPAVVVSVSPNSPLPAGANAIGSVSLTSGTAVQLTDGTRNGTIKAASTSAVAADTSLVVAISPNSPLPTGNNTIGAVTFGGMASNDSFQTSVTTSAAALASHASKQACVRALSSNTDVVWFGGTSGVTAATGTPVYPGETLCRPVANTSQLFFLSSSGTQTVAVDYGN